LTQQEVVADLQKRLGATFNEAFSEEVTQLFDDMDLNKGGSMSWEEVVEAETLKIPDWSSMDGFTRFNKSLTDHTALWVDCFGSNSFDQVTGPGIQCVRKWAKSFFAGLSDSVAGSGGDLSQPISFVKENTLRTCALKLMSSLFTIKSVLHSTIDSYADPVEFWPLKFVSGDLSGQTKPYLRVKPCGCGLSSTAGHVGAADPNKAKRNALGTTDLMLPVDYIQDYSNLSWTTHNHFTDEPAVMEWLPFPTSLSDPLTEQDQDKFQHPEHCASSSVFTSGICIPSLKSGVYHCCKRKEQAVLLAEANAFSSFVLTSAGLILAFMLFPCASLDIDNTAFPIKAVV
jgi:hypothetical protein